MIKSLCVYCGSNPGTHSAYREAAHLLGTTLAKRGITLVYGGGNVGLMGIAADAALAAGGKVIGVIPEALEKKEVAHYGLTELHIVGSMHERKKMLADLSDAFVALPGGIGTIEEIIEVFAWSQLGIHLKTCALLNTENFYEGQLIQLRRMVKDQFLRQEFLNQLVVADTVDDLLTRVSAARPVLLEKLYERVKVPV
jgi:hypothetical protein